MSNPENDFRKSAARLRDLSTRVEKAAAGTPKQNLAGEVAAGAREVAAICDDVAARKDTAK